MTSTASISDGEFPLNPLFHEALNQVNHTPRLTDGHFEIKRSSEGVSYVKVMGRQAVHSTEATTGVNYIRVIGSDHVVDETTDDLPLVSMRKNFTYGQVVRGFLDHAVTDDEVDDILSTASMLDIDGMHRSNLVTGLVGYVVECDDPARRERFYKHLLKVPVTEREADNLASMTAGLNRRVKVFRDKVDNHGRGDQLVDDLIDFGLFDPSVFQDEKADPRIAVILASYIGQKDIFSELKGKDRLTEATKYISDILRMLKRDSARIALNVESLQRELLPESASEIMPLSRLVVVSNTIVARQDARLPLDRRRRKPLGVDGVTGSDVHNAGHALYRLLNITKSRSGREKTHERQNKAYAALLDELLTPLREE